MKLSTTDSTSRLTIKSSTKGGLRLVGTNQGLAIKSSIKAGGRLVSLNHNVKRLNPVAKFRISS